MGPSFWLSWALLLFPAQAQQDLRAELRPSVVSTGEVAELWVWTPEGSLVDPPLMPVLRGLRWLDARPDVSIEPAGPSGGRMLRWRWRLRAETPGRWAIPPLLFRFGADVLRTPELYLEVRTPSADPPPSETQGLELWMRTELSRSIAYPQEPVYVETALYFHPGLQILRPYLLRAGQGQGGWWEVLARPDSIPVSDVRIGGRLYRRAVLERALWYPLAPGEYAIGGAELECEVQQEAEDPLGEFLGRWMRPRDVVRLLAEPARLRVRPWPEGAPASFSGSSGLFSWAVSWPEEPLRAGTSALVRVRIWGRGNPHAISPSRPHVDPQEGVIWLGAERHTRTLAEGQYEVEFRFPVVFQRPGRYRFAPYSWTYFDPVQERYVTLRASGPELRVEGASAQASEPNAGPQEVAWPDWRRQAGRWVRPERPWWARLEGWGVLAGLWILVLAWVLRPVRAQDQAPRRMGGARAWSLLAAALRVPNPERALEALYQGLRRHLGRELGQQPEQLCAARLRTLLEALPERTRAVYADWCALLEELEARRFRPDPVRPQELAAWAQRIRRLLGLASKDGLRLPLFLLGLALTAWARAEGGLDPQRAFLEGLRRIEEGRYAEARALYQAVRESGWLSPGLLYNLGLLEARLGQYGAARYALEEALRLEPGAADMLRARGLVLRRLALQENAWERLLWRARPEFAVAPLLLGAVLLLGSRRRRSRHLLRTAVAPLCGLVAVAYLGYLGHVRYQERVTIIADTWAWGAEGFVRIPAGYVLSALRQEPDGLWVRLHGEWLWLPAGSVRLSRWR
ncbi:MAG: tetratricopeptide repeat protein [Bacteroidota bacterium]|nr:tetratricopeptide repeat protein [Rhodothermia bacterium]MDW8284806.1 tetratricopeptide repeat protein [Bacteroidota bacterium]